VAQLFGQITGAFATELARFGDALEGLDIPPS